VAFEYDPHQPNSLAGRDIGKSQKPGVRDSVQPNQRCEVLVQGDENAVLPLCGFKKRQVAGIGTETLRFKDIMPFCSQPLGQSSSGAAIN